MADYELDISNRKYTVMLHHALGQKYSEFPGSMVEHALRGVAKVEPKTEATKNSVVITFDAYLMEVSANKKRPIVCMKFCLRSIKCDIL